VSGSGRELGGCFALGPWRVHRAGYGAMQLAGDGVFGPPRDRDEALRVLCAAVAAGVNHTGIAQYYGTGTVNELIRRPVLASPAARLGATPVQVALAWLLALAPNILLIPGTRTRAHLAENLRAADIRFDDAAHAELTRHFPEGVTHHG
jgi:aryl-alcohol dehydrogenase-like predicted oxidoreductase